MTDDLRELLRLADGGPARPDHDDIRGRARRQTATRVVAVLGAALVGVAGVVGVAVSLMDTGGQSPVIDESPSPAFPETDDEQAETCERPSLRPTYLPWLEEGEDVPAPVDAHDGDRDDPSGRLVWAQDPGRYDPDDVEAQVNTVTITLLPEYETSEQSARDIEVRGEPGTLLWTGDPGIGPVSLLWREEPGPCAYSLSLLIQGTPDYLDMRPPDDLEGDEVDDWMQEHQEAIEGELIQVANSLVDQETSDEDGGDVAVEDEELIDNFLRFTANPGPETADDLPLADEVALGLDGELHVTRNAAELSDPQAWKIDVEHFRAYVGPFSAIDLAGDANSTDTVVSIGDHPHCASPPQPPPAEVANLRRVSVQPDPETIDGCLQWWTVDLFVTDDREVAAVTLDVFEP